jgi:hypothetical protein
MLGSHLVTAAVREQAQRATAGPGRPLLDLQQRFVELRFGIFLHFNMATFQDLQWGDPTSSPDLFHPTALDTNQRGCSSSPVCQHHLGMSDDPTSRWLLYLADQVSSGKRETDGAFAPTSRAPMRIRSARPDCVWDSIIRS